MENDKTNIVYCILNLREASDCIKNQLPDLSLCLLKIAGKLAYDMHIAQSEIDQNQKIVESITS